MARSQTILTGAGSCENYFNEYLEATKVGKYYVWGNSSTHRSYPLPLNKHLTVNKNCCFPASH